MIRCEGEHRAGCDERFCCLCGGTNIVWRAPHEAWNTTAAGRWPILCPSCFAQEYELVHGPTVWTMTPLGCAA